MTENNALRRLSSYSNTQLPRERHNLIEIQDVEVTIHAAKVGTTQMGEFAAMECELPTGERMWFVTSGFIVIDAIKKALDDNALPLQATFRRPERAWIIE